MTMPQDAVTLVQRLARDYAPYDAYYNGIQPLTYSSDKYNTVFSKMVAAYYENMCPAVVDPLADRLVITGFEVEGSDENSAGKALWDLWRAQHMDRRAGEIHLEAIKCGDAYVIVWPDPTGAVRIYPQLSGNFAVRYSDDGSIEYGAKLWVTDDKFAHLTLYYIDRVERYTSREALKQGDGDYSRITWVLNETVPNVTGRIPVFHFANNAPAGYYGKSELKDVVPIQDALNKSVADLLVAMEFAAFNQRWATGLELKEDPITGKTRPTFEPGVDHLWASESTEVSFGEFASADLEKFIQVHDMFVTNIARVTGTPIHYMLINPSSFPSGESLKTAEQRFVSKVEDRQASFGEVWEDVLTYVAQLSSVSLTGRANIMWQDASPRSELESVTIAVQKKTIGVSAEQNFRELGYSEDQIAQMQSEKEAESQRSLERQQQIFAAGGLPNE